MIPTGMLTASAVSEMNLHLRDRGIHQEQTAHRQQDDPPDRKHAVTREFGFGGEQREGSMIMAIAAKRTGSKIQSERRQQNEDHADSARNDRARMIELRVQAQVRRLPRE